MKILFIILVLCLPFATLSEADIPETGFKLPIHAVQKLKQKAENGDAKAQYQLGEYYYQGDNLTQNFKEAVNWYRKAAERELADAQCALGFCYFLGTGVEKDYNTAIEWLQKAADKKNMAAQCLLGVMYYFGLGVESKLSTAVELFVKGGIDYKYLIGYSDLCRNLFMAEDDSECDLYPDVKANKVKGRVREHLESMLLDSNYRERYISWRKYKPIADGRKRGIIDENIITYPGDSKHPIRINGR